MHAMTHGGALVLHPTPEVFAPVEIEERGERQAATPGAARPALFERVVRRRPHDYAALAVAAILVSALVALGVWMTLDVGEALAIARVCDGKCVPVAPR